LTQSRGKSNLYKCIIIGYNSILDENVPVGSLGEEMICFLKSKFDKLVYALSEPMQIKKIVEGKE